MAGNTGKACRGQRRLAPGPANELVLAATALDGLRRWCCWRRSHCRYRALRLAGSGLSWMAEQPPRFTSGDVLLSSDSGGVMPLLLR
jgi:hypothetical protein